MIGADRLAHGDRLYGAFPKDDEHGDTYGPVVYEAYVPFEQAMPWGGSWDDLPAAHGAAIAFDLLAAALLFLLGRRVRGPDLGIALAYAWAAYPFTLYALNTNTNDTLVAALVLAALLAAARPALRGAAAAAAGLTKFAPLALAPLLLLHEMPVRVRRLAAFAAGFAATAALVCLPLLGEDLSTAWDRTIGFQSGRGSPFSVWGCTAGRPPSTRCRRRPSCWPSASPWRRARATSARSPPPVPPSSWGCSWASRTGSTSTSCGSSRSSCSRSWAAGPPDRPVAVVLWHGPLADVRITDVFVYEHDATLLATVSAPTATASPWSTRRWPWCRCGSRGRSAATTRRRSGCSWRPRRWRRRRACAASPARARPGCSP